MLKILLALIAATIIFTFIPADTTVAQTSVGYPLYQVLHVTYGAQNTEVFLLETLPNNPALVPTATWVGQTNPLPAQSSHNPVAYPYAYVVGNGSNFTWSSSAAAKAAAIADATALVNARNSLGQLTVLSDSPVYGPN
jgi:hypothetical protein